MPRTTEPGARPIPSTAPARTACATSAAGCNGRGDRSTEYAARRSRAIPPLPGLHLGHALFEQARRVVGPRTTTLVNLADPLYDDLVAEATLALIEGADPMAAVRRYRAREAAFGRVTCPLLEEAA